MANANPTLPDLLRARLRAAPGQQLPWVEVMEMALYEPGLGYYRTGVRRIGRGGDFYTSVSVGPLFGQLLAEFAHQVWCDAGRPERFTLIEQGAHDGTLARDVLTGCQAISPGFFGSVQYLILEPEEALRQAQRETLGPDFVAKLHHDPASCTPAALFLSNELLDAFPVHRVRWDGQQWQELYVREDSTAPSGFALLDGPLSTPLLAQTLAAYGPDLPPGWTTEVNLAIGSWLEDLARLPFTGAVLVLDYGFTAEGHFSPDRPEGTLRRYLRHRMDDKVLEDLGNSDLTSHVDFTQVGELAAPHGFTVGELIEQGRFLTRLFVEAFQRHGTAPDAATQRQFHTLTHPGQMGRSFHALILRRDRSGAQM